MVEEAWLQCQPWSRLRGSCSTSPFRLRHKMGKCVIVFGVSTAPDSVCFVCSVPSRRRCGVWASSRAPGGCPGASVSVVGVLHGSLSRPRWVLCRCVYGWCLGGTGFGVSCCLDACAAAWLGFAVCGSCSVVDLRWWAGVYRVCVLWWFPALVPACFLPS